MSLRSLSLAACVAATLTLATASPAGATDIVVAPEAVTVRVSHADLNLASEAGRARLERRIAGAARGICGTSHPADLRMSALVGACRADAITSARLPAQVASNDRTVAMSGNRMSRAAN
jgi:UrcA family protein